MELDPNGRPRDKLFLIRPILEIVKAACKENYVPDRDVTVDEAMIAFRGRHGLKQYMPNKPTKYGIKVWQLSVARNGYCSNFSVYLGKPTGGERENNLGKKVVLEMSKDLVGNHNHVYFDNFFTSTELLEELLAKGLYGCGTIRSNRKGLPDELRPKTKNNKNKNLAKTIKNVLKKPGDSVVLQNGSITALAWLEKKSRKPVLIACTNSSPDSPQEVVPRKQKDGSRIDVPCPLPVKDYNGSMNGVDRTDQMRTEYVTTRMSKRWWLYIFYFLVDLAIANAFALFRESYNHAIKTKTGKDKERTMLEFRMALVKQLVQNYRRVGKRRSQDPDRVGLHWPMKTPTKRKCRNCTANSVRRESRLKCKQCSTDGAAVNLCPECFEQFHSRIDI